MKGSGSAWVSSLRKNMIDLGFTPCRDDGDVWMRVSVDTSELVSTTHYGLPVSE